jgi:hypothetical protein
VRNAFAAVKALVQRHRSRGATLLAERNVAIEERNEAKRDLAQQLTWGVIQAENITEGLRHIDALRAVLVRLLWRAVAEEAACSCVGGQRPSAVCEAWRVLGFGEHFNLDEARDLLPTQAEVADA